MAELNGGELSRMSGSPYTLTFLSTTQFNQMADVREVGFNQHLIRIRCNGNQDDPNVFGVAHLLLLPQSAIKVKDSGRIGTCNLSGFSLWHRPYWPQRCAKLSHFCPLGQAVDTGLRCPVSISY